MMYQSKLVASLKANNKILREFKDTVYVPFASEYSILIKNLNTVRALVNVFIDGAVEVYMSVRAKVPSIARMR